MQQSFNSSARLEAETPSEAAEPYVEEGLRVVSDPAQPAPADLEVVYYVYDEDDQLVAKVSTFSFQAGGGWAVDSLTECRDAD